MSIEAEIRRTNAWVKRRINPKRLPRDEQPVHDYEFQVPQHWRENLAIWAKWMLVVITCSAAAGYISMFYWVINNVGHYR